MAKVLPTEPPQTSVLFFFFFYSYDRIPEKKHLKEQRVSSFSLSLYSNMVGSALWLEQEAAGHIVSRVRKQSEQDIG